MGWWWRAICWRAACSRTRRNCPSSSDCKWGTAAVFPLWGCGGGSKPHPPGHLQHAPDTGRAPWMFVPIMSDADPYNHCPPENEQQEQSGPDPGQDSDDAPPPSKAGVHTYRFCILCEQTVYRFKRWLYQGNTSLGGETLLIPKWYTLHSFRFLQLDIMLPSGWVIWHKSSFAHSAAFI